MKSLAEETWDAPLDISKYRASAICSEEFRARSGDVRGIWCPSIVSADNLFSYGYCTCLLAHIPVIKAHLPVLWWLLEYQAILYRFFTSPYFQKSHFTLLIWKMKVNFSLSFYGSPVMKYIISLNGALFIRNFFI